MGEKRAEVVQPEAALSFIVGECNPASCAARCQTPQTAGLPHRRSAVYGATAE